MVGREFCKIIDQVFVFLMKSFEEFQCRLRPGYHLLNIHQFLALKEFISFFHGKVLIYSAGNGASSMNLFACSYLNDFLPEFSHHYTLNGQILILKSYSDNVS